MKSFYLTQLVLFLVGISQVQSAADYRCIGSDWIAFQDKKCYKILDTSLPFLEAREVCKQILPFEDLTGCNHPSTLLTIDSSEEQEFIQSNNLLSPRSQNAWLDEASLSEDKYRNWASGEYPIFLANSSVTNERSCVELELNELTNRGKWRSISCQESRRVVCQNVQILPIQVLQHELIDTKRELLVQKAQIRRLNDLIDQLLISQTTIAEADKTIHSTNGLIQQLQENCIRTEPIDLKADRTDHLETEVQNIKSSIKSLDSDIQAFKKPLDERSEEIAELQSMITEIKVSVNRTQAETDWLKDLSEAIKATMVDLNQGLESLTNLFKGSQAPLEVIRGETEMLQLRLGEIEIPFHKAQTDIEFVRRRVNEVQEDVIRRAGELQGEMIRLKGAVITNVRFGGPQHVAIWKGPGYNDEYGWVITSVSNFNHDAWPDGTSRRRIQKFVNGVWSDI